MGLARNLSGFGAGKFDVFSVEYWFGSGTEVGTVWLSGRKIVYSQFKAKRLND